MQKYLTWLGTSLVAIASFVFTVFPILNTTPRFVAIGILVASIGVLLTLPMHRGQSAGSHPIKRFRVRQNVTASGNSNVVIAGRDLNLPATVKGEEN